MKKHQWVLRDLSNGDGADPGVTHPRYIWVFDNRQWALAKAREHRDTLRFAKLGPVEKWPVTVIEQNYERAIGSYYHRKKEGMYVTHRDVDARIPDAGNLTHYIIVRRDLPLGVIAAQTTHAAGESFAAYVERWKSRPVSPTYAVVLEAASSRQLRKLEGQLKAHGVQHKAIREPDAPWNGALMAIGLWPVDRVLVRHLLKHYRLLGS